MHVLAGSDTVIPTLLEMELEAREVFIIFLSFAKFSRYLRQIFFFVGNKRITNEIEDLIIALFQNCK